MEEKIGGENCTFGHQIYWGYTYITESKALEETRDFCNASLNNKSTLPLGRKQWASWAPRYPQSLPTS